MDMLDVNVLIYAFNPQADRHAEYVAWLDNFVATEPAFCLSELACAAFVRIVTNSRIFQTPATLTEAFDFIDPIRSRSNCLQIYPTDRHWQIFRHLCHQTAAMGNLITDAYFAALAIEHSVVWVTTDRDFAKFPTLQWRHPLSP